MFLTGLCLYTQAEATKNEISNLKSQISNQDDDRVYLVHADELRYDQWKNNNAQVLRGSIKFFHKGAYLYCDSANFFQQTNSFEAWGNVRMEQGDTLSLTSDYGYYDGDKMLMTAKTFTPDKQVVLRNRQSTLYTDTLYFDRIGKVGYYNDYGKLVDQTTTLTSDHGEYHTDTKDAFFNNDVRMVDKDFVLTTDNLEYNTRTTLAHIVGPSDIVSGNSRIYSEMGYYNTTTKQADLLNRSRVSDEGRNLTGDSLHYDGMTGVSQAFRHVEFHDETNKNRLLCEYGIYNDSTGYAMCTDSTLVIDYSQRDSLFMHADTIKVYTYNIRTDSVYRIVHAYNKVRAYRIDIQGVCDSLVYNSKDSCMTMYRDPIVWNQNQQLLGEQIDVYMKDSVVDHAHVINQALSIQDLNEPQLYNQLSSRDMLAFFQEGDIHEAQAIDNVVVVYYPVDDADSSYVGLVSMETSQLNLYFKERKLERIWAPKSDGTMYPMSQIPPAKRYLPVFVWFDYVRPVSRDDVFEWRPKRPGTELKSTKRREPQRQSDTELKGANKVEPLQQGANKLEPLQQDANKLEPLQQQTE